MLYRQYFDNDLGFKGADIIYWGPASFQPPSINVIQGKSSTDGKLPVVEAPPSTEEQVETTPSANSKPSLSFLSLPLEIRRMIYGYVHNMHPIQYTKLMNPSQTTQISPWFPRMPLGECRYRSISAAPKEPSSGELSVPTPTSPSQTKAPLLTPQRPFAGFQSPLLRVSRQIYYDSREYPLRENEFVFFTWMSSGFWAARAFTTRLQPWQRDAMQWVRLEVMAPDLQGACDREWEELCGWWAQGLRGLRLKILGVGAASRRRTANVVGSDIGKEVGECKRTVQIYRDEGGGEGGGEGEGERVLMPWVERGLKRMANLEHLEVELLIPGWDDQKKLEWCRSLDEVLNDPKDNRAKYVDVISVERA